MDALGIEQKSIGHAGDDKAKVIADTFTQPEPVCPAEYGREINSCLLQGFGVLIHVVPRYITLVGQG